MLHCPGKKLSQEWDSLLISKVTYVHPATKWVSYGVRTQVLPSFVFSLPSSLSPPPFFLFSLFFFASIYYMSVMCQALRSWNTAE